jgi:nitrogen fixation-related uncharacterized protein
MFEKKTVRIFSIVAIVLSVIGLLISVLGSLIIRGGTATITLMVSAASWAILLWAAIIGYKLCTSYNLYEEEYKKVGYRIYAIIIAFVIFFFVGMTIGLLISVIILSTLWSLKSNYDDWKSEAHTFLTSEAEDKTQGPTNT